jgi:thiamine-phosphate pyrophosphorylase
VSGHPAWKRTGLDLRLYAVLPATGGHGNQALQAAGLALEGGATVLQYRDKQGGTRSMWQQAQALRHLCHRRGVPLLVNDRLDIALAVDAAGVHLGQGDLPVAVARRVLGPQAVIGVSVLTLAEALHAADEGADYVSVSPLFATATKPDAGPPAGLAQLALIARHSPLPVIAIGGISAANAADAIAAGAAGVAVVSAIFSSPCPRQAAAGLRAEVDAALRRYGKEHLA